MNTIVKPDPTRTHRRWVPLTIVAVLAISAIGVSVALVSSTISPPTASPTDVPVSSGDEDDVSNAPLTSVPAPTSGALSDDEEVESTRASVAIDSLIAATDEIAQRGDGSAVGLESIATGWVLGELQSKAREQYDLGYRQEGAAEVTSVTTTAAELAAVPATITLKVCVDVSAIDVVDAAGNSLKDSLYNPGRPVAHLYGAVFEGDTWKISTHEIPDVQDCPAV